MLRCNRMLCHHLYYPYVPQEVVSSGYSSQGYGATEGVILSSGQQTGMGSEYYQSSLQTVGNTQENFVSYLNSENSIGA
ncbi:hypothetical protein JHK87_015387 [Glycine soja]|nr:hypothetical protein JHK87_015387 [Glycine soja]